MLNFNSVTIHNFFSYGHAEIDLKSRGFCLVTGKNNYVKDNALSNGSGKSAIWSAICYALTGETIQGIHSNLKNINIEEPECYVSVDFNDNETNYIITRYISPKTDLKIFKNGTEVGGKGIRESTVKLAELLPDLTKDLISSTIILGQGMPNRFSSFSPSGRKEMLEKLTKSDFMIEDIKTRVTNRLSQLSSEIREIENKILITNTKRSTTYCDYKRVEDELARAVKPDFDSDLLTLTNLISSNGEEIKKVEEDIQLNEKDLYEANDALLAAVKNKGDVVQKELEMYNAANNKLQSEKTKTDSDIRHLENEIYKLKSIKDTCPTCGQKLPGVERPDTTKLEEQVKTLRDDSSRITVKINECLQKHRDNGVSISNHFDENIGKLNERVSTIKRLLEANKRALASLNINLNTNKDKYSKLVFEKQSWDERIRQSEEYIKTAKTTIEQLNSELAAHQNNLENTTAHLEVVRKMETLVKRDFRGFLLTNIISYIDKRAKDFSERVFGTRELNVYLNGNSLDISYCGKMLEVLSGGERMRADLILQLAIRDLLQTYFNYSTNIIVLDEVTDFLDQQSCQAVMSFIENELNSVESVFIVSHHASELSLPIDSEITIVKNEEGISEVF